MTKDDESDVGGKRMEQVELPELALERAYHDQKSLEGRKFSSERY